MLRYARAELYAGIRDARLESALVSVCTPSIHTDLESFLTAIAASTDERLLVVAEADAQRLPTLVAATQAASRWGPAGLHHHLCVASRRPNAKDIVAAFHRGCDGFIPLPCTTVQMLRGLPVECRGRYPGAPAQVGE